MVSDEVDEVATCQLVDCSVNCQRHGFDETLTCASRHGRVPLDADNFAANIQRDRIAMIWTHFGSD